MQVFIKDDMPIQSLFEHFAKSGHEIRLVGGAVRDIIKGQIPKDYDFATTATPDQMMDMITDFWKVIPTGIDHGTVTFMSPFGSFEVTTLRQDVETDGRHAVVEFTSDWKIDAARRDFTMNAMSMDRHGNIFDYFEGQKHMTQGMIHFVGDAKQRIEEDALRIIRFFRQRARFKLDSTGSDEGAILNNIHLLKKVSTERVWQEIKKAAEYPYCFAQFFQDLRAYTILEQFGFEFDPVFRNERINNLESYIQEFPEFAVTVKMTEANVHAFAEIFKVSSAEKAKMIWFAQNKDKDIDTNVVEDLINAGVIREWVQALTQFKKDFGAFCHAGDYIISTFPVTGNDLIALGVKPGKPFGIMLEDMKSIWKESRYTLTKDEIIDQYHIERYHRAYDQPN